MNKKDKALRFILPTVTVLCIFLLWGGVALAVDSNYIFPSVRKTAVEFIALLSSAEFYSAFFMTVLRSVIAFCLSFVIAFLTALLCRKFEKAELIVSPIISVVRSLPTIAVVLLLLFWVNRFIAPIIVTLLVVLPTLYTNLYNALGAVDKEQYKMCKLFNVCKKDVFTKIQLPQIMPSMLGAIGSGLALNLKLMVAAEVISATSKSMGRLLNNAQYNAEIAQMFALVFACVIAGLIIELTFHFISKKAGRFQ